LNLPTFDQTRKDEHDGSPYPEAVRLSNELRPVKPYTYIDTFGKRIDVTARWGFHCEIAPYKDFTRWLNDKTIKKSESLFWFVIRIMVWRFPEKHTEIKNSLNISHRKEFELILSQMKKEVDWVGTVGFQNMVRLDKSLNNDRSKIIKKRDGTIEIRRK